MKKITIAFLCTLINLAPLYEQVTCIEQGLHDGRFLLERVILANISQELDDLKCGDVYPISDKSYLIFEINSKKPCHYSFLGSKIEECTASVFCSGNITLRDPAQNGTCVKEFLAVTDGTQGFMSGCGSFSFKNHPLVPLSNGKDIYVYFKGKSDHHHKSKCIVFCVEDIGKADTTGISEVKKLKKNRFWNGLQMHNTCVCGEKNLDVRRIVGGTTAAKFEFPWMAAVVEKGYDRIPFCGAALVNNLYAVTAAHCLVLGGYKAEDVQIVLHAHVMDKEKKEDGTVARDNDEEYIDIPGWALPVETDESENSTRIDIEHFMIHPLHHGETGDYDIALLKLKTKVNLSTPDVSPICLPTIDDNFVFEDGENMLITGWGKHNENAKAQARVLQKVDVPFVNRTECGKYVSPTLRHFCAGHLEGKTDSCVGDSGGPMIRTLKPKGNQYFLSGIISVGWGCAMAGTLAAYTNVQEVIQWIYYSMNLTDSLWCRR